MSLSDRWTNRLVHRTLNPATQSLSSTATGDSSGGCTGCMRGGASGNRVRLFRRWSIFSCYMIQTWGGRQHPLVDLHITSSKHILYYKEAMSGKGRIIIVHSPLRGSQALLFCSPSNGLPFRWSDVSQSCYGSASTVQRSIIELLGTCSLHRLKIAPQINNFISSKLQLQDTKTLKM